MITRTTRTLMLVAALTLPSGRLHATPARPGLGLGSPLGGLVLPHHGRAKHDGSFDRSGANNDFRLLTPGESLTLFDYKGAGIVHRFWVTFLPRANPQTKPEDAVAATRQTVLRMFWDGEPTPSVETPLGDFFGVGFGAQREYTSLPLEETSGGYNCYWPMPFHRAAHWTLTNMSGLDVVVWWNIDFTAFETLPRNLPHFHAQWRRENPTAPDRNYTILEASGRGHYVGAALFMQNLGGVGVFFLTFLEGDEMIYFDGEKTPSVNGTGTEDYFGSGFYFDRGPYAAPYHGAPIVDWVPARVSAYRWHIEEAMPFSKSVRVTIEHGSGNGVEADYSSVAYFYQEEPHAPFPPFPSDPSLLLPTPPPLQ